MKTQKHTAATMTTVENLVSLLNGTPRTTDTISVLADGMKPATVRRLLAIAVADGRVVKGSRRHFVKQNGNYSSGFFGGAGVMKRDENTYRLADATDRANVAWAERTADAIIAYCTRSEKAEAASAVDAARLAASGVFATICTSCGFPYYGDTCTDCGAPKRDAAAARAEQGRADFERATALVLPVSSTIDRIAALQEIQKRNAPTSFEWQLASEMLQPLFREMADAAKREEKAASEVEDATETCGVCGVEHLSSECCPNGPHALSEIFGDDRSDRQGGKTYVSQYANDGSTLDEVAEREERHEVVEIDGVEFECTSEDADGFSRTWQASHRGPLASSVVMVVEFEDGSAALTHYWQRNDDGAPVEKTTAFPFAPHAYHAAAAIITGDREGSASLQRPLGWSPDASNLPADDLQRTANLLGQALARIADLEADVAEMHGAAQDLRERLAISDRRLDVAMRDVEDLSQEQHDNQRAMRDLITQVAEARLSLSHEAARASDLRRERDALRHDLDVLDGRVEDDQVDVDIDEDLMQESDDRAAFNDRLDAQQNEF